MRTLLDVDGLREAFVVAAGAAVLLVVLRARPAVLGTVPRFVGRLGYGLVLLGGAVVGLRTARLLPDLLVVALVALGAGGRMASHRATPGIARSVALVPGAALLAVALPDAVPTWAAVAVFCVTVAAGRRATTLERSVPGLSAVALAVSAVGIYVCVPETGTAGPVLAALAAAALLAIWWLAGGHGPVSAGGATIGVGLLVWSAAVGGYPRSGSVVGGLGCLGVIVLLRAREGAGRGVRVRDHGSALVVLLVVHVAVVGWASRVAGQRTSALSAALLLVPAFAAGLVLLARQPVAGRSARRR